MVTGFFSRSRQIEQLNVSRDHKIQASAILLCREVVYNCLNFVFSELRRFLLLPLIPKPTPKPTQLHPSDLDPTPPPGSRVLQWCYWLFTVKNHVAYKQVIMSTVRTP